MTQHNSGYRHQGNHSNTGSSNNWQNNRDPKRWERQRLEDDLRRLKRDQTRLLGQIDAVERKGKAIEAEIQQHNGVLPAAVVVEIVRALVSAAGLHVVPQAYRPWAYKREALLKLERELKDKAIDLHAEQLALQEQIQQVEVDLDLLKYKP